jgi:para-nitrobenzyl esterase
MSRDRERPPPVQSGALVEVVAPCGHVRGRQSGSVRTFRGIPYGAAPVGERRFAPAETAPPFEDPFDAVAFGTISAQDIDPLPEAVPGTENLFYAPGVIGGEDCLNLNIWSPVGADDAPVLVYIHGGGFLCGSGTGPWFDGTAHAREHGLVVVTLNYRLGILGGLYLGEYAPGRSNLGLLDQMLALRWVQNNIAGFGGDPDRVTVSGESAGAMSIAALLFAPAAEGLFRRAFVESGHLDMALSPEEAAGATRRALAELRIPADAPDVLDRLRHTSLFRILAAQRRLGIGGRLFPTVDDDVVLSGLAEAAMPDWARRVDLLVGTTQEENRLFTLTGWASEPESPKLTISRLLDDLEDQAVALGLYESDTTADDDPIGLSHRIITDRAWSEPARRTAALHADSPARTYHYSFAWRSNALDGRVGAAHVVDIPFFFGNLEAPGVEELLGDRIHEKQTQTLAQRVSACLAQFVATGDLAVSPLGNWPAFSGDHRATMVIDVDPVVEVDHDALRLNFWSEHRGSVADSLDATVGGDA